MREDLFKKVNSIMKMRLNVICEVLAILAIALVNVSFIGLFGFEIQGPENAT